MTKITPLRFWKLKFLFGTFLAIAFQSARTLFWASVYEKNRVDLLQTLSSCVLFSENTWQLNRDEHYVARFRKQSFCIGDFFRPRFFNAKALYKSCFLKELCSSLVELAAACFVCIKHWAKTLRTKFWESEVQILNLNIAWYFSSPNFYGQPGLKVEVRNLLKLMLATSTNTVSSCSTIFCTPLNPDGCASTCTTWTARSICQSEVGLPLSEKCADQVPCTLYPPATLGPLVCEAPPLLCV